MTPYYHQSNISTPPPTPREGNTFPPLKSHLPKHNHDRILKSEALNEEEGEESGPFDEDDIELQLSSPSFISNAELGLKVLRYCSIAFLGLVIIGLSIHITNHLYQTPTQLFQICESVPPGGPCTSEDRTPLEFKHGHDYSNKEPTRVPTYPPNCNEAGCLIHQIPGQGAEPIATATILSTSSSEPRFTIVGTPPPTSPPICVPPHCYPHPSGQEDYDHQPDSEEGLKKGEDESPPICVPPHCYPHEPGETPPICVPPHCYSHPPPGHHHDHDHDHHHHHHHDHHHHHHEKEGETTKEEIPPPCFPPHCYPPPLDVDDESPPICVPPHCFPHTLDHGDYEFGKQEQQDNPRICSDDGCTPNTLPGRPIPECVAPYCYPRNSVHEVDEERQHGHDHDYDGEYHEQVSDPDHPIHNAPKACHPPYCYPPTPPFHPNRGEVGESPPTCVPPHCYPSNLPGHEDRPLPNDKDQPQSQSPPICVPPHCYPHSKDDEGRIDEEDQQLFFQADQEREDEYFKSEPEIIIAQDQEYQEEDVDDDKPICMPPICVPPAKSAPIFVPCDGAEEED